MPKITKKKAIELILSEMEKGNIDAPTILAKIGKEWQIAERTFYRYYNEALPTHQERQQAIQKQLEKETIEQEKKRIKREILTKHERLEIAARIAKGNARKLDDKIIIPSDSDILKALDYLSKIEGDYAPIKQDVTTQGESLNQSTVDLTKLDLETLKKIKESQKSVTNQKNDN